MKSIDLFCQGEGVGEIVHIELELDATFAVLKAASPKAPDPRRCAALHRGRGRTA